MNHSAPVAVRTFVNHFAADVAKTALDAAGIESVIASDDCGGTQPALWQRGVAIVVGAEDAAEAAAVLDNPAQPAGDNETVQGS